MKKHLSSIMLIIVFFAGLGLLVYPSASDYWNSLHQTRAIASYAESISKIDNNHYEELLAEAIDYNRSLEKRTFSLMISELEEERYRSVLDVTGTGIMAYIEIPEIKCSLPIYHGTDEAVLARAIGHIAGTSLPVGGKSTHCVLSGHRGLPSAKLFTDIDKLIPGDTFMIRTLDDTLTYEVDTILIVLPTEVDDLAIREGEDLCTLVTCTPYGINSHRLLVTGHRIDTVNTVTIRVTSDALQIDPVVVAPLVAAPILLVLLIHVMFGKKKKPDEDID